MTDDIVAFIRARLDEDEQIAREASTRSPWRSAKYGDLHVMSADPNVAVVRSANYFEEVIHIAQHEPARVLRGVEAKRKVLNECARTLAIDDWEYTDAPDLAESALNGLASEWSTHPDYRQEWQA